MIGHVLSIGHTKNEILEIRKKEMVNNQQNEIAQQRFYKLYAFIPCSERTRIIKDCVYNVSVSSCVMRTNARLERSYYRK